MDTEPEPGFPAVDSVVATAIVCTDGAVSAVVKPVEEAVLLAVAMAILVRDLPFAVLKMEPVGVVVSVDKPPAVVVIVPVIAVCVSVVSEAEAATVAAAVKAGMEAAAVYWLMVGPSLFAGTSTSAGSQKPGPPWFLSVAI